MKELFLCVLAFSVSMIILNTEIFAEPQPYIDKEQFQWMECESLSEENHWIETQYGRHKALKECTFGGYYPLGPATEL